MKIKSMEFKPSDVVFTPTNGFGVVRTNTLNYFPIRVEFDTFGPSIFYNSNGWAPWEHAMGRELLTTEEAFELYGVKRKNEQA